MRAGRHSYWGKRSNKSLIDQAEECVVLISIWLEDSQNPVRKATLTIQCIFSSDAAIY